MFGILDSLLLKEGISAMQLVDVGTERNFTSPKHRLSGQVCCSLSFCPWEISDEALVFYYFFAFHRVLIRLFKRTNLKEQVFFSVLEIPFHYYKPWRIYFSSFLLSTIRGVAETYKNPSSAVRRGVSWDQSQSSRG